MCHWTGSYLCRQLTAGHQDITWLVTNSFMWYYLLIYACYGSDNDDNVHFKYVKMMVVKPDAEYVINTIIITFQSHVHARRLHKQFLFYQNITTPHRILGDVITYLWPKYLTLASKSSHAHSHLLAWDLVRHFVNSVFTIHPMFRRKPPWWIFEKQWQLLRNGRIILLCDMGESNQAEQVEKYQNRGFFLYITRRGSLFAIDYIHVIFSAFFSIW